MLLIQDACTLLGVYILLLTEISFLCVLSYTVYCVSNNKLCTCFVVFASLKSFFAFKWGKYQGTLPLASSF